jgi:hypothetical protein
MNAQLISLPKYSMSSQYNAKNCYSPFCVPAKVTKLIGLKRPLFLSPTNLITFAGTQNGEYCSEKAILQ